MSRRPGAGAVAQDTTELVALVVTVDDGMPAALASGGLSDGPPGLRPHDRVRYYAAFVLDPDGNRIEAVTFPSA